MVFPFGERIRMFLRESLDQRALLRDYRGEKWEERKGGRVPAERSSSQTPRDRESYVCTYVRGARLTSNDLGHRFLFQSHRVDCTLKKTPRKGHNTCPLCLEEQKVGALWCLARLPCSFARRWLQTPIIQDLP